MAIMARVFSKAFSESSDGTKDELLKHLVLFCTSGLFVLMLALTYGIDLSPGFF
jgi:ABC-type proline/glycine betaine transport system permease subunit